MARTKKKASKGKETTPKKISQKTAPVKVTKALNVSQQKVTISCFDGKIPFSRTINKGAEAEFVNPFPSLEAELTRLSKIGLIRIN